MPQHHLEQADATWTSRRLSQTNDGYSPVCKRGLDLLVAIVAGLIALPVLVFCALWIWMIDGGPVIYRQWRVGRDGWLFEIYKFRTMRKQAERDGARFASAGDPRVLPGCRWMRRSHADELPQLFNILLGHMSVVGPRPERPEIVEQLRPQIPGIDKRHLVPPGLTGLAQLRNGYSNDLASIRRKVAWDLKYMRHRSLAGDVKLIMATAGKLWDHAAM